MNAVETEQIITDLAERGCAESCADGQSTADASQPVRKQYEPRETRSTQKTVVRPAGRDWAFEVCRGQNLKVNDDGAS